MMELDQLIEIHKIVGYDQYVRRVKQAENLYSEMRGPDVYNVLHDFVSDFFLNMIDGAKLVMFGNGGSAADCDHIVGEFRNRFVYDRKAINAISLSDSISTVTAIGNDFSFDAIFAKQLEGILDCWDSVIALSTSGKSRNVVEAGRLLEQRFPDINSLIITGLMTNKIPGFRYHIQIPIESNKYTTARIQEVSMFLLHMICGIFDSICETSVNHAIRSLGEN